MTRPVSISLKKFTSSVQRAVKAATARHPKFKLPAQNAVSVSYLIRGIPVPEEIAAQVTLEETQAFAADVAAQLARAHPEALAGARRGASGGAVLSVGRHVLIGIPAPSEILQIRG